MDKSKFVWPYSVSTTVTACPEIIIMLYFVVQLYSSFKGIVSDL